jgi:hypothetical protein
MLCVAGSYGEVYRGDWHGTVSIFLLTPKAKPVCYLYVACMCQKDNKWLLVTDIFWNAIQNEQCQNELVEFEDSYKILINFGEGNPRKQVLPKEKVAVKFDSWDFMIVPISF